MDHFTANVVCVGTIAAGTTIYPFAKAPSDGNGGGLTITEAYAVSSGALAAGSAWNLELVTLSGGSASALNGTIGTLAAGSAWTAGTVRSITVATPWVDGGYYIGARFIGTAANATNSSTLVVINAVMGR
jgi:hypothetical protein